MIQQNDILEVSQVGNGFIVRVAGVGWFDGDRDRRVWVGARDDYLVFRTMAELQAWLAEHFTHRAAPKLVDTLPVHKPNASVKRAA